jgi:hypothetical protein
VDTYFSVYQFHVANADAVLAGEKPRMVEKGPYVFRSKGINEKIEWSSDFKKVSYSLFLAL